MRMCCRSFRNSKKRSAFAFMAGITLLMGGCSINPTLVATGPHAPGSDAPSGLRYHLAKDVIQVTATRTDKSTRRPKKDLSGPEVQLKAEVQVAASLVTVADDTSFYVIDATPGRWSDSLLTVKASGDGLLQSINSESTGQTGEFLKSLGQAAATIAGAVLLDQGANGPWPPENRCLPITSLPPELVRRLFRVERNGTVGNPEASALPKELAARLFVLSEQPACELWQKLELAAYESELQRLERARLAAQLRVAEAKEIPDIKKRLEATGLALAALAGDREIWLAAFRSGLEDFEKRYEFGSKVKAVTKTFDFDPAELPPDSIIEGEGLLGDRLRNSNWSKALELFELGHTIVTRHAAGSGVNPGGAPKGQDDKQGTATGCSGSPKDKTVRLYYRGTEPVLVTVYGPDDDDNLVIKKQELMQLINREAAHCVEFAESGFAVRKLKLEMDARGRITLLDRSSTSEAKGVGSAIAGALTAARDAYADTLTKVVNIQENRRKIDLNDLEMGLARLKKEKEIVDADVGLQGALSSRESTLEQQRLAAELAALQARLNLETAQANYANNVEVAELKAELEKLKQQLELLKAQLALQEASKP